MRRFINVFTVILLLAFSSCVNTKKVLYFQEQKDGEVISGSQIPKSVIQSNDMLNITVTSLSAKSSELFNVNSVSFANGSNVGSSGYAIQPSGYLVSSEGTIKFPYLGKVQAAGYSEEELEEYLTAGILEKKLLLDPIVTVRHLNFKVTVLGEVGKPTVINVPNEKISVLEAIGIAGDLTIFGKRDNILLIREEDGKKVTKRLNLNSSDFLSSPYYYLQSNDVIYVEPSKAKAASAGRGRHIAPVVFSVLSFAVIVVDRMFR